MIKLLMTGGGAPGAAGIIRCLKKSPDLDLLICDANPEAVGRYLHDKFETIPAANDPLFIPTLLDLCTREGIQIIMPLVTRELFLFAKHKNEFNEKGIKVLVSNKSALDIANNKSEFYNFLSERGLPLPEYRVVSEIKEFEDALYSLGYPNKKVCFKPSVSNGSRGFRIIDSSIDRFDLLFNHKPDSTYISFDEAIDILKSRPFPELLVSEFLPGEEYSVDCLAMNGEAKMILPRLRKKMLGGISVQGEFIQNEEIINYSREIIRHLELNGNIGIQFKKSDKGKFLPLEINPRVQGTIVAGLGAGINLPLLAVKQELGLAISDEELDIKWGVKFSRYWEEVYY